MQQQRLVRLRSSMQAGPNGLIGFTNKGGWEEERDGAFPPTRNLRTKNIKLLTLHKGSGWGGGIGSKPAELSQRTLASGLDVSEQCWASPSFPKICGT